MRWHVQSVGRIWGDGGVTAGGVEALGGEFRTIRGVNHVMRDSRMVRVLLQERLEEGDGLLAVGCFVVVVLIRQRYQRPSIAKAEVDVSRVLMVKTLQHRVVSPE